MHRQPIPEKVEEKFEEGALYSDRLHNKFIGVKLRNPTIERNYVANLDGKVYNFDGRHYTKISDEDSKSIHRELYLQLQTKYFPPEADEDPGKPPKGGKRRTRRRQRSNKKRTNKRKKTKTRMKKRKTSKRKTNKRRRKR